MQVNIRGEKIVVTSAIKEYVEEKKSRSVSGNEAEHIKIVPECAVVFFALFIFLTHSPTPPPCSPMPEG